MPDAQARYERSEKGRARVRKYGTSDKGRAAKARYDHSGKRIIATINQRSRAMEREHGISIVGGSA
jgi:hypothetical protein